MNHTIQVITTPTNKVLIIPSELQPAFNELVFRATNLWPDAPAAIKDFADTLVHGHPLQDYAAQDTSKSAKDGRWAYTRGTCSKSDTCSLCAMQEGVRKLGMVHTGIPTHKYPITITNPITPT